MSDSNSYEGDLYEGDSRNESDDERYRPKWASKPRFNNPPETRTVTHKLYGRQKLHMEGEGQSEGDDEDEPAVLWSLKVYDLEVYDARTVRHNPSDRRPFAIYIKDKPLELLPGTQTEQAARQPPIGPSTNTLPQPTWIGCVFDVCCDAVAARPSNSRSHQADRVTHDPDAFKALDFQSVSHKYINIRSPFLCRAIKAIAGYYPDFLADIQQANWADATTVQPLDHSSSLKIYEPWGILLHRFPEMKTFVGTPETKSGSQDAKGIDTREGDYERLEKEHMRHLVGFLEPYYVSYINPCIEALRQQKPQLAFSMLWYVFAPGTDVYCQDDEVLAAPYVIMSVSDNAVGSRSRDTKPRAEGWYLEMWFLDSDGHFISRNKRSCIIPAYSGLKALTSLNICPVSVWDAHDRGERRKQILLRNGLVFQSLQKGHLLSYYNGPIKGGNKHYSGTIILDHKRGAYFLEGELPKFPLGMDHASQFREYDMMRVNEAEPEGDDTGLVRGSWDYDNSSDYRPGSPEMPQHSSGSASPSKLGPFSISRGLLGNVESEYTSESSERSTPFPSSLTTSLSDHQLFLLRPRIRAFALKTKEWLAIHPEGLQELKQSEEGIKNLVLGDTEMKTIKGLSKRQNSKRETWAADFIEGKGTGQIILLHGPPGVGKTYTVEATSEYLHRPLLSLTITDIGTIETNVERQLIKWFSLAEAWNAVLLVDEADILLERRQNRDLARNGLVSAFLRRMEYFKGLLFLTTNRVGQIDDAFISRVHVAIGYDALTSESRSKIWQGFFRKLAKERAGKIQISPAAKKWVLEKAISGEAQLNGRDIRNALQTAITLAEAECEEDPDFDMETMTIIVDQSHFQSVLDITNKFQSYVQSIRREDEKKRAAGRYDRNDYYKDDVREEQGF